MANIGIAKASYYADTSISRLNRDVVNSVEKVSKAKDQIAPGDKASLVSMDNTFKLDLAGKSAAIKSMSLTQAYLSTAISTLENASAILKDIHSLAVLGANGSNSTEDNQLINMEAEALADAFHKSMTAAQFKGKEIFTDEASSSVLSAGGRSTQVNFGVGKVDYDMFYDYDNPALKTLNAGVKYQIRRELTADEKAVLMNIVPDLSEAMIRPGLQFTTPEAASNIGLGEMSLVDPGEFVTYNRGQGNLQLDAAASATVQGDFRGGFLDFTVSSNFEDADRLTLQDTTTTRGDIAINDQGVISFTFDDPNDDPDQGIITVDIGELDAVADGTQGLLRINLYGDATTPGSGNLLNGDFDIAGGPYRTQFGAPSEVTQLGVEHRDGIVETTNITNAGSGYVEIDDSFSTPLTRGSNTYSINFDSTKADGSAGTGTGFRANVIVADDGTLSIGDVLNKGQGYEVGDILTVSTAEFARGDAGQVARPSDLLQGTGFSMTVASISNANDGDSFPATLNDTNVQPVSEPRFITRSVQEILPANTLTEWGQSFNTDTAKREIAAGGTATNVLHTAGGNYTTDPSAVSLHADVQAELGAPTPFVGVYNDDTDPTSGLIVDFNPVFSAGQNVLEQVSLADYAGGDTARTNAVYKLMPDGSTEEFLSYGAVYDAAPTGTQYVDTPEWSNPAVPATIAEKEALVGAGTLENDQYRFTEVFDTTTTNVNPNDNSWTVTDYREHDPGDDGVYAWGAGSYSGGMDVKIQNQASGQYSTHEHHTSGGNYNWNIAGTNFTSVTIEGTTVSAADGLAYNAGDIKLEYVDVNVEAAPAGATVYVSNEGAENEQDVFWVRIENENGIRYDLDPSEWSKNEVVSYTQQTKLGYNRQEIAFYTRQLQVNTQEISSGTAQVYDSEIVDNSVETLVGYERSEDTNGLNQGFIPHWTTYDGRVEFGSTFQITDTENGTLIDSDLAQGTYSNTSVTRNIPTPPVELMAQPDYGDFIDLFGNPGNPDIQNKDDAATVGVLQSGGQDARDYADTPSQDTPDVPVGVVSDGITDPFSGNALELFTGKLDFENDAAFGIYHGPAVVSDQFRAEEGQFLRLNYTAAGDVDNFHVAGYIYQTDEVTGDPILDENGDAKITMAISETGDIELNGRASVEIEEAGDYRFVFIVGTFDETGGLAAGASMRIDNIVAEFPYSISEEAVSALLQSVNYSYDDTATIGTKTVTATLRNSDDTHLLTDDAVINLEGFDKAENSDGPYMLAPTLNLVTTPSEGAANDASILTSKIEEVQQRLNNARVQAGSQYAALEEAIDSTTDLRAQFALGSGTLSDLNFSLETAHLTRRQMQQDVATTMLAQANKTQSSLVSLVDGSYRTYLNAQFSHLK